MKVIIDRAIEKNIEMMERIDRANRYLEPQLGRFKNEIEAEWTTPSDRLGHLALTLRFTDYLPVAATDSFSADVLSPGRFAAPWLRSVVNALFGKRADLHLSRVRQMLDQLKQEEATSGAETCPSPR